MLHRASARNRYRFVSAASATALLAAAAVAAAPSIASGATSAPPVGPTLFFHSASGSYATDALADPPAALEGRAPAGSTVDATEPTDDSAATATYVAGLQSGSPNTPTFSLAEGVPALEAVCYDVFLSSDLPQVLGLTLVSAI